MLELTLVERELGKTESVWKEAADRHYASAKRAIDQLVASQGDFETEGELTFEDGMVSCSALQIGMLALMQQDEKERKHYTDAMLQILNSHDCLTQCVFPMPAVVEEPCAIGRLNMTCRCCLICSTRLTAGVAGVLMPPIMLIC